MIRWIRREDAEAFVRLRQGLDRETSFMLMEPDERRDTREQTEKMIGDVLDEAKHAIWVVEEQRELVGFLSVKRGEYHRNRHVGYLVIGILQSHTGKGWGTRLFQTMEKWAEEQKIHRLELTVMTHNEQGIALYRKMGFQVEGIKRDALWVDRQYVDEYYMAKLLPES
ncbi:GNAT family N-acetyltransferase [Kroppenstedtia pulmonis]|uniref:GNAT family N-acetyltransferase n=1 Tax=Kroppenstedtia pulmonis TaxID=1380685 RepID=A0A7D3XS86_9BACL|nr:GNAT family protein [Kroppenstedtia pulmonis]QKG84888.1 GNAT family N-acetyltransferase [Kroppenstedtia pulmonis]